MPINSQTLQGSTSVWINPSRGSDLPNVAVPLYRGTGASLPGPRRHEGHGLPGLHLLQATQDPGAAKDVEDVGNMTKADLSLSFSVVLDDENSLHK